MIGSWIGSKGLIKDLFHHREEWMIEWMIEWMNEVKDDILHNKNHSDTTT